MVYTGTGAALTYFGLNYDTYTTNNSTTASVTIEGLKKIMVSYKENFRQTYYQWWEEPTQTTVTFEPTLKACNTWNDYYIKYSNTGTGFFYYSDFCGITKPPPTMKELLAEAIKQRMAPSIIVRNKHLSPTLDIREIRARETLQRVVGEVKYRDFLKKGYVSAFNRKSGRTYQIFPGHGMTRVYEKGRMIQKLCVVLTGDFPPTDSVIIRYLMALKDEKTLWTLSNKHVATQQSNKGIEIPTEKNLINIFQNLKKKVAA